MSMNVSKIMPDYVLDEILERVKIKSGAKNDSQVSVPLGTSRANLSAWRKRGTIPFENLYAFSISYDVNFDWLMFGDEYVNISRHDLLDFVQIPFYKIDISAGNGGNPTSEEEFKPLIFRSEFFDNMGLSPKNLVGANVPGDSMEPLIPSNSGILIDTTDKNMTDGKVYVFNADGNLLVKKIIVSFDGFLAHSINDEYDDIPLSKDKVDSLIIVGRARLALPYIKL